MIENENSDLIPIEELPKVERIRKRKTNKLMERFERITRAVYLRVDPKDYDLSLSGARHAVKLWNRANPNQKLTYTIRGAKTNHPIMYVKLGD